MIVPFTRKKWQTHKKIYILIRTALIQRQIIVENEGKKGD